MGLAFRLLCGSLATVLAAGGVVLIAAFLRYHAPNGGTPIPTGPMGHYFAAFAGCALIGWSAGLYAAARRPELGRPVGTGSAVALVLCAVVRMLAWLVGDYAAAAGEILRIEAALALGLALAFVWLRPPATPRPGVA